MLNRHFLDMEKNLKKTTLNSQLNYLTIIGGKSPAFRLGMKTETLICFIGNLQLCI